MFCTSYFVLFVVVTIVLSVTTHCLLFLCYVICLFLFCIPLLLTRVFTTRSAIVVVRLYFFSSFCIFLFFFFFFLTLLIFFPCFSRGRPHISIQLLVACKHSYASNPLNFHKEKKLPYICIRVWKCASIILTKIESLLCLKLCWQCLGIIMIINNTLYGANMPCMTYIAILISGLRSSSLGYFTMLE